MLPHVHWVELRAQSDTTPLLLNSSVPTITWGICRRLCHPKKWEGRNCKNIFWPPLITDMVSSCVVQYSTVLCQKQFWVVSNLYLYHTYYVIKKTLVCYFPTNFGSLLLTPTPAKDMWTCACLGSLMHGNRHGLAKMDAKRHCHEQRWVATGCHSLSLVDNKNLFH